MKYEVQGWGELTFSELGALRNLVRADAWPVLLDLLNQNNVTTGMASLHLSQSNRDAAAGIDLFNEKIRALKTDVEEAMKDATKNKEAEANNAE